MSQFNESFRRTFIADQDFSAGSGGATGQYTIVALSAGEANTVQAAGAPTDALIIGVIQDNPKIEGAGVVQFLGTTKVRAHTTVNLGDKLTAFLETTGVYAGFATANPTTTTGNYVIGIALQAANANDIFEMLMVNYKY